MANNRRKPWIVRHFSKLGFTNRLAIYILIFLAVGLAGGFYLALKSIVYGFNGSLLCWTVVFTPLGTVAAAVLGRVVEKNRDENTSADGMGIAFAAAQANGFVYGDVASGQDDEPTI